MLSIGKLKVSEKNLTDVPVRTSFSSSPRYPMVFNWKCPWFPSDATDEEGSAPFLERYGGNQSLENLHLHLWLPVFCCVGSRVRGALFGAIIGETHG